MHDESKKERLMTLRWLLHQGGEGILKQGVQKGGRSWGGKETQRAESIAQKATGGAARGILTGNPTLKPRGDAIPASTHYGYHSLVCPSRRLR